MNNENIDFVNVFLENTEVELLMTTAKDFNQSKMLLLRYAKDRMW